jgi:hypothetical protein
MESKDLIRILKEVPETRLRIIDLAWKVVGEDGAIDPDKVALHYKELKEATDEAEAYSEATKEAVKCLEDLARSST